jgi:hypothetical protein
MHLLLEGTDLQELLSQVREQHGPAARVVRAERIRTGGVAGFFSKERYEVTVEMDGEQDETAAPAVTGEDEEREALDFEALLAAADAAEATPEATPEVAVPTATEDEDFESARAGLLQMLRASGTAENEGLKESAPAAEEVTVIAQTGESAHAESAPTEVGAEVEATDEDLAYETAGYEDELLEEARREIEEIEQAESAAAERALEEERMLQQQEIERQADERREAARADVRRRQAERMQRPAPQLPAAQLPAPQQQSAGRSLGEVLAAADAAEGTHRLEAMLAAGRAPEAQTARPHRPISTESDTFARTMASMRSGATRTPATGVTGDVRSVTTPSVRPARPRPERADLPGRADVDDRFENHRFVEPSARRPVRTPEDRVSDQFAANGSTGQASRGPRRPELRRPAAVEEGFGDQFGDRFEVERAERQTERRGDWSHDYEALEQPYEQPFEAAYEQDFAPQGYGEAPQGYGEYEQDRAPRRESRETRETREVRNQSGPSARDNRTEARNGDDQNEAMSMDLTYREPVTTYSDRPAPSRMSYREPQDTGDVLRLARDIDVPAPLRVGAGELVVVIGEADAVVSAALLVADEVGSEAPLVLGRADVQNTITADELPARQDQARRWSAPLTVAIPARPTGADAERAARMAAEIGAASIVVCVDATRRSHAVASLLRALESVGLPARRLAVHRAAESPDPLDVLSLDVPVGFLDGRPATSGAWAGLLLDAAGDPGMR